MRDCFENINDINMIPFDKLNLTRLFEIAHVSFNLFSFVFVSIGWDQEFPHVEVTRTQKYHL